MEDQLLKHGGRRSGSGRKPLDGGTTRRLFTLTPRHSTLLTEYRRRHGFKSDAEALRRLLESTAA